MIPAILNAVYNATGIRFQELPLTPERVYKALREHEKRTARAGKRKNRLR
jgi:hypothetical protein